MRAVQAMEAATSLQQLKRAQEEFRRGVLLQVLQTLDASPVFGHSALVGMLECAVRLAELMPQLMRGGASVQVHGLAVQPPAALLGQAPFGHTICSGFVGSANPVCLPIFVRC